MSGVGDPTRPQCRRRRRTGNGEVSEEIVGVGGVEPIYKVRIWKFTTNDGRHVKRRMGVKSAGELEGLEARRDNFDPGRGVKCRGCHVDEMGRAGGLINKTSQADTNTELGGRVPWAVNYLYTRLVTI